MLRALAAAFSALHSSPPCLPRRPPRPTKWQTLRLDWAYYNPVSLVLRDKG